MALAQLRGKVQRYKHLAKSYTAQLNHQTYLANHYATRLEEEERKCDAVIIPSDLLAVFF